MKNRKNRIVLHGVLATVIGLGSMGVAAHSTSELQSIEAIGYIERAKRMLSDGNYLGVIDQLRGMNCDGLTVSEAEREERDFLIAIAMYERGDEGCLRHLEKFVIDYPASVKTLEVRKKIGDYYYFGGEYGKALDAYSKIESNSLSGTERSEYAYRKAYCTLRVGEFDVARAMFEALQGEKEYRNASTFYLAYLDYVSGDYDKALEGFSKVTPESGRMDMEGGMNRVARRKDISRKPAELDAAVYIQQIKFRQGKYSEVASQSSRMLQTDPPAEMKPELNRIVGESYFRLGNMDVAHGYLDTYLKTAASSAMPSSLYAMGAIEYERGNNEEAMRLFSESASENDEIGQSSNLYLGQCLLQQGERDAAAIAFEKAYRMGYNSKVSEVALYNYAVVRSEGGKIPFSSSADILEEFLEVYPRSKYTSKIREYLATAYYNDRNYLKALENIDNIAEPTREVLATKQKIYYTLGVEAMRNSDNQSAISYMGEASKMTEVDKLLAMQSSLWLSEAYYNEGEYSQAEERVSVYLKGVSASDNNRAKGYYTLGYSQYMQNKFEEARKSFEQSLRATPKPEKSVESDIYLRIGDCCYYTARFVDARTAYSKAIQAGGQSSDYASLQHAIMQGMTGNDEAKLKEIDAMLKKYPESVYYATALLEKAHTERDMRKYDKSLATLERLIDDYPQTSEARRGLLYKGVAQSESGKTDGAVDTYKELIRRWPSSEEAVSASEYLAEIYASRGRLTEYSEFLTSIEGAPRLDTDKIEKLNFEAAEQALLNDSSDIKGMQAYVEKYPDGTYLSEALYALSDYYNGQGKYELALSAAEELLKKRSSSVYATEALRIKATILEQHIGDTPSALKTYKELELRGEEEFLDDAYLGIIRTSDDSKMVVKYAEKLFSLSGMTAEDQEEARYYRANAYMEQGQREKALLDYSTLSANPNSYYGSRAAVEEGEYYLGSGDYRQAETKMNQFIEAGTPHSYWLARGYIVLADALYAQDKGYMAQEYMRSLKENYPGDEPDIHQQINHRLKEWAK